jgi:hypothetical protein
MSAELHNSLFSQDEEPMGSSNEDESEEDEEEEDGEILELDLPIATAELRDQTRKKVIKLSTRSLN